MIDIEWKSNQCLNQAKREQNAELGGSKSHAEALRTRGFEGTKTRCSSWLSALRTVNNLAGCAQLWSACGSTPLWLTRVNQLQSIDCPKQANQISPAPNRKHHSPTALKDVQREKASSRKDAKPQRAPPKRSLFFKPLWPQRLCVSLYFHSPRTKRITQSGFQRPPDRRYPPGVSGCHKPMMLSSVSLSWA